MTLNAYFLHFLLSLTLTGSILAFRETMNLHLLAVSPVSTYQELCT